MKKNALIIGGSLGALAVILGALGAHALKSVLSMDQLNSFETAVRFQMYHALLILLMGFWERPEISGLLKTAYRLVFAGTLLFSGSIYLLSTREITGLQGISWLGPVTPLGGILLIAGWIVLIVAGIRMKKSEA